MLNPVYKHSAMQTTAMQTTYFGVDVSKDLLHISHQPNAHQPNAHQPNAHQPNAHQPNAHQPNAACAHIQAEWDYQKLPNQISDIETWAAQLPAHSQVVFEHTGTYSARLAWVLALMRIPFSIITPTQSKGFAATLKSISKTDRSDALMLARYGQTIKPGPTTLAQEALHQLRQRQKHLNDLRTSLQALSNQLHALSYDPRANGKVKESLLALSESYQTQIDSFEDDLDQFSDQELTRIGQQMQRVSGIGQKSAAALSVATNGFGGFESAKAVAKFIGIAPTMSQSGSSVHRRGRMARTGLGYVRGKLYMAARSAIRFNLACKALYERLRAKGKCYKVAMVAVMNKLLHQVFAVVKKDLQFVNGFGLPKQSLA